MEITLKSTKQKKLQRIEKDHYWYDSYLKKMLHGRGGRMVFKFDPYKQRSVPYIIEDFQHVTGNNYDEIESWIKKNQDKFDIEIKEEVKNYQVTIDVSKKFFFDILGDLFTKKIMFDFDEKDLKYGK